MGERHSRHVLAEGISRALNPVFVSAAVFALAIICPDRSLPHPGALLGICLFFGVCLPVAYVGLLLHRGHIDSFFIPYRAGRLRPLLVGAASYLAGLFMLRLASAPPEVWAPMLCCAVNAALAAALTLRWKISLHAVGAWGALAVLTFLFGPPALFAVPAPLAVSWARVAVGAHTPAQIIAGGGMAVLSTCLLFGPIVGILPFR